MVREEATKKSTTKMNMKIDHTNNNINRENITKMIKGLNTEKDSKMNLINQVIEVPTEVVEEAEVVIVEDTNKNIDQKTLLSTKTKKSLLLKVK